MRIITLYICLIPLFAFSACTPTKEEVYKQCKKQVETINKMPLSVAYLVPVDSLGQYMNDELISSDMYDHCEVVANVNPHQVHIFAVLYFDSKGRLRKSIEWWSDGGDLRNVGYYDEQGLIIYAVYDYYDNNCGRLYAVRSQRYIERTFAQSSKDSVAFSPAWMVIELASRYKTNLQTPKGCRTVSFLPIQEGDRAFLCTNKIYANPQKTMATSREARWGELVFIDSITADWCSIRKLSHDAAMGYVSIDSIELGIKKQERDSLYIHHK